MKKYLGKLVQMLSVIALLALATFSSGCATVLPGGDGDKETRVMSGDIPRAGSTIFIFYAGSNMNCGYSGFESVIIWAYEVGDGLDKMKVLRTKGFAFNFKSECPRGRFFVGEDGQTRISFEPKPGE